MMTVREHMKLAGYDPDASLDASDLHGVLREKYGTMECESIELSTVECSSSYGYKDIISVSAVAIVPYTDGGSHPYPSGWPHSLEAKLTVHFPAAKEVD